MDFARAVCVAAATAWLSGTAAAQDPAEQQIRQEEAAGTPRASNLWTEGRLFGVTDSVSLQQSSGVVAVVGADTKPVPWLTTGLGVSYESFTTKNWSTNLATMSNGVGFLPYLSARLSPSLYVSAFGGITHLNYTTALAPGIGGQFDAWRLLGGAALTGVWRERSWRLQPEASFYYGGENQQAYTTSAGGAVAAQSIPFGRISAGPEIGYAFTKAGAWAIEPFVKAKGNFDYIVSNSSIFNGATFSTASRGQWSATLGAGATVNTSQGFFARLEASNESVFQNGLNIWLGQVRGGWNF